MSLGPINVRVFIPGETEYGTKMIEVKDSQLYVLADDYAKLQRQVKQLMDELQVSMDAHGQIDTTQVQRVLDLSRHEQYLSNLVTQIRHVIQDATLPFNEEGDAIKREKITNLLLKPYPLAPKDALDSADFAKEMAKTPEQLARDYHGQTTRYPNDVLAEDDTTSL